MQINKVIAIVNSKGGTGKSTTALNMSAWLNMYGKRKVLLIDADGQANLTACININMANVKGTLFDLLTNENVKATDIIYKDNSILFDVIIADERLNNIDLILNGYFERERQLAYKLEPIINDYDYIIIDCSPSLNLATINCFVASDYLIIPVQSDYLAIRGTTKLLESVNKVKERMNPKLDILGVFATMYDNRKLNDRNIYDTIQNQFQEKAFKTIIRENVKLKESPMFKKSIFEYELASNGAIDYNNLMIEIWKRLGGAVNEKQ